MATIKFIAFVFLLLASLLSGVLATQDQIPINTVPLSCQKGFQPHPDIESNRTQLILNSVTLTTLLTQQPNILVDNCDHCPPTCTHEGCPPGCCDFTKLAKRVNIELEELIGILRELSCNTSNFGVMAMAG